MDILVGYTGFVGANIVMQNQFDSVYNSKNIQDAYGLNPDSCIYTAVRAEKFLANADPDADLAVIHQAIENIKKINPKKLILISTIDVFQNSIAKDEASLIDTDGLHAYGRNRYYLEEWVATNWADYHILRLPALFGKNIKKNFIYDFLHVIPSLLTPEKFRSFAAIEPILNDFYTQNDRGFYQVRPVTGSEWDKLIAIFKRLNFSAVNFTDSRSVFQFYNLNYLYQHIQIAVANALRVLHLAVAPVSSAEVYQFLTGNRFENPCSANPQIYDFRTQYETLFNGANGYIFTREKVLNDITAYVKNFVITHSIRS